MLAHPSGQVSRSVRSSIPLLRHSGSPSLQSPPPHSARHRRVRAPADVAGTLRRAAMRWGGAAARLPPPAGGGPRGPGRWASESARSSRCASRARAFGSGGVSGVPARGGGGHLPFLAGVCAGAAAGGVGAYALLSRRGAGDAVDTSVDGTKSAVAHPAMRAGWPSGFEDLLRVRSGFVASYDARTRNPRWVLERITAESCDGVGTRKKSRFAEDDEVDGAHAAKLSDYRGSGYDRGHLAAAAGHKNTQRAMDDTFSLINVSPQVGDGFNRDYWARLEHFTRILATKTKAGGDVLVATGPLFLPTKVGAGERRAREFRESMEPRGDGGDKKGGKTRDVSTALVDVSSSAKARPPADWEMRYPLIGDAPELVHVPTHFFKVVLVLPAGDRDDERLDANDKNREDARAVAAAAFVLPNAPIPPDTPLETFIVPLAKLEAAAGLTFFRQGALGGEAREAFEASERLYFESRSGGEASETAARVTSRSRSKSRAEHVCQAAACVLPAGFAAKQTRGG